MISKKQRFDFYKAIQAVQFHAARMKDATLADEVPGGEAEKVSEFLDALIKDLGEIKANLDSGPVPLI